MTDPYASICYRKNFLKEVIVRIDLLNSLPGVGNALPSTLTEVAIRNFPIPEPRQAVHREVKIGPEGISTTEESVKEWLFHGKERTKTLTIGQQVLLVQHTAYETYELLKGEFTEILNNTTALFQDIQPKRVGLRYVNTIEVAEANPIDWSAYISPHLLALFDFPPEPDRSRLSRVFHNVELSFDAFNLRYRFGMHNPDYPARIRQKMFVLDLDAFTQSVVAISDVAWLLDEFHSAIQRYFELSITNALRSMMNAA